MKTLLFNPGPTNVSESVREALKTPDICHREKEFSEKLLAVNHKLVQFLGGENTHSSIMYVASGTGANEAIISSIHGKILLVQNGKYAERLGEIAARFQVPCISLLFDPLKPVSVEKIEVILENDPHITHVLAVHHETTTGALAPIRAIGELCLKHKKLFVVDGISSIGGHDFDLQKDNIAFCSVSANKCLEGFPGLSFVVGRNSELEKLAQKSRSFYFDLHAQWEQGKKGQTPFTPAVQLVFAMDEALNLCLKEGREARVQRYAELSRRMRQGLEQMGLELLLLPENLQSNILTTIKMPEHFDYERIHDGLKARGITIYSDANVLKQRKFRVATLGAVTIQDVDWFLANLQTVWMQKEGIHETSGYFERGSGYEATTTH